MILMGRIPFVCVEGRCQECAQDADCKDGGSCQSGKCEGAGGGGDGAVGGVLLVFAPPAANWAGVRTGPVESAGTGVELC